MIRKVKIMGLLSFGYSMVFLFVGEKENMSGGKVTEDS